MAPVPSKIIYQAIALYRGNFTLFFLLSLRSTLWAFISVASLATIVVSLFLQEPIVGLLAQLSIKIPEYSQYSLIFIIISTVLSIALCIFASAQVQLKTALIGLLAYQSLTGQHKSLTPITEVIRMRFWHFWMAEIYIGIILGAVNRLIDRWISDPIWSSLIELLTYTLITGQYFLTSMLISVDLDTARQAWKGSKKQFESYPIEICATLILTWLMTVPLYLLAFSPAIAVLMAEWSNFEGDLTQIFTSGFHLLQALGLSIVLATALHALVIPLWQSIKAVLYSVVNTRS
jgi:hypothetical protein